MKPLVLSFSLLLLIVGCDTITTTSISRQRQINMAGEVAPVLSKIHEEDNEISLTKEEKEIYGAPENGRLYFCRFREDGFHVSIAEKGDTIVLYAFVAGFGQPSREREERLIENMKIVVSKIEEEIKAEQ